MVKTVGNLYNVVHFKTQCLLLIVVDNIVEVRFKSSLMR